MTRPIRSRPAVAMALGFTCATAAFAGAISPASAVERGMATSARPEIGQFYRAVMGGMSCTGTLVTPQFVLTASHCVAFSDEHPEQYRFAMQSPAGSMKYTVAQIYNFGPRRTWGDYIPRDEDLAAVFIPAAPSGRGNTDVALVRLTASVPSDVATPAGVVSFYPQAGVTASVFGYGYEFCHGVIGRGAGTKRVGSWTYQVVGGKNQQKVEPTGLVCTGDSGGPAVLGGPWENGLVWGVVSSSSSSWDTYGDFLYFRPWMDDIVRGAPSAPFQRPRGEIEWWLKLRRL